MRFWLQAVKLSKSVSYRFIVNDKEVTSGEVGVGLNVHGFVSSSHT